MVAVEGSTFVVVAAVAVAVAAVVGGDAVVVVADHDYGSDFDDEEAEEGGTTAPAQILDQEASVTSSLIGSGSYLPIRNIEGQGIFCDQGASRSSCLVFSPRFQTSRRPITIRSDYCDCNRRWGDYCLSI
jgi:hypothetical protein